MFTSFDATAVTALISSFAGVANDLVGVLLVGAAASITIMLTGRGLAYIRRWTSGKR